MGRKIVARANPATAQTNTALVPPRNNMAARVSSIFISSDVETIVSLVNSESHSLLFRQYVGAKGGVYLPIGFDSAWGEGLDYTTSANGDLFLMVEYFWVGRG